MFYVPRGYLLDFTNYLDLEAMTKFVKKLAKKNKAYVVKIDPNFARRQYSFKGEEVCPDYSKDFEIKNTNLEKLGYKCTGIHKEMGKNMSPQYNMLAPICDKTGKVLNLEELLNTYKSKFKYYIGSFHEKRGITFEITDDIKKYHFLLKCLKKQKKNKVSV